MKFVSERLKMEREAKGLTYDDLYIELAKRKMKVSKNSLINWERGHAPKLDGLIKLSRFYGRNIEYFFQ